MKALNPDVLLKIMLRYHMHYLAEEIGKYLRFGESFVTLVHLHWASLKVAEKDINDNVLC
jgi:hypothetical protein